MVAEVVTGNALWVLVAVAGVVPALMVYFAPPARVKRSGWQYDNPVDRFLVSAVGVCRVVEYTVMVVLLVLVLGVGWQETSFLGDEPSLTVALVWVVIVWMFLRVGRYWLVGVLRRSRKELRARAAQRRERGVVRPGLVRPPARVPVHVMDEGAPDAAGLRGYGAPGEGLVRPPARR